MTKAKGSFLGRWTTCLVCVLAPFLTQAQCTRNGLTAAKGPTGAFMVVDERGQPVSSQPYAAARSLTTDLVQVCQTAVPGPQKWGVVNRQGRLVLPLAYDQIDALGCDHLQTRQGPATYLFDAQGREILRDSVVNVSFKVSTRFDRILVLYRKYPPSQQPSQVKVVSLHDPRKVYYRGPGNWAAPFSYETQVKGRFTRHELPFLQVDHPTSSAGQSHTRLLDWNGHLLLDSILTVQYSRGLLFLQLPRFDVVTDTLLRPLPALSHRYQGVWPTGPGGRWFEVHKSGKSGVVDRTGRVVLPLVHEDDLTYLGANNFLAYNHRTRGYTFLSLHRPPVDLSAYYVERSNLGADTTRSREPLPLKHQKTAAHSWLNPATGVITPVWP